MEEQNNETVNVQQPEQLTGRVSSQAMTVSDIVSEAVNQPTKKEQKYSERLALLDGLRIVTSTEVPPEEPSLSVDNVGFFALDDIHAVKAKQKQGKTTTLKICLSALLKGQMFRVKSELTEPVVLWLDTEQKAADVKLIISDVKQMTGLDDNYIDNHLYLYPLRKMNYETLKDDTELLIDLHLPKVVIVDGVVDYVASFNDEVASRKLIHDLLVLCEEKHCAIINVLHENKAADDSNMRGHLGTVLSQAAGTVLECRKSRAGIITVSCSDPRHGVTPPWSFRFDADGNIIDADILRKEEQQKKKEAQWQKKQAEKEQAEKERLDATLDVINSHGGALKRNTLTELLATKLKVTRPTVSKFLSKMIKEGKLFEADKTITATPETVMFS
jgi:hypothetical protein